MTKKEIVKQISERIGLTQLKTKDIVQQTFDAIVDTLLEVGRIELRNFGVFEVKRRKARKARNPRTGDRVDVPPKNVVTFKPGKELAGRAAPTEKREGRWIQGEVHDPRSFLLGGVAGHAGLFSTADEIAVYAQMLLNGGSYAGKRVLSPATVRLMTTARPVPGGQRALVWDVNTRYSSNRGELFGPGSFGQAWMARVKLLAATLRFRAWRREGPRREQDYHRGGEGDRLYHQP